MVLPGWYPAPSHHAAGLPGVNGACATAGLALGPLLSVEDDAGGAEEDVEEAEDDDAGVELRPPSGLSLTLISWQPACAATDNTNTPASDFIIGSCISRRRRVAADAEPESAAAICCSRVASGARVVPNGRFFMLGHIGGHANRLRKKLLAALDLRRRPARVHGYELHFALSLRTFLI